MCAAGFRVAIIYGALPPGARRKQAQLFNDPDNDYKVCPCGLVPLPHLCLAHTRTNSKAGRHILCLQGMRLFRVFSGRALPLFTFMVAKDHRQCSRF